jgi:Uma2 family endonuclease
MSLQPHQRYSPQEYLELERKAEYKSEYFNGEIFAMSGASEEHNLIVGNVFAALHNQFRGRPCKVYASDMRVKVGPTGLYTYPDVIAVCEEAQLEDAHLDTLLNPTVLIEVLSRSTEAYDRGEKAEHYRRLPSLAEYLLISQDKPHLEHYLRQSDNRWLLSEASELHTVITLPAIDCTLSLAAIYDRVFSEPAS